MCGIYIITNSINGKVYVGSASNVLKRWGGHKRGLTIGQHPNRRLQAAWNKYGQDAFLFSVALLCAKQYLIRWEQIVIDAHASLVGWDKMYNLSPTAGSTLGVKCSQDTRRKVSVALKGKKNRLGCKDSPEACRNRSNAIRGNSNALGKNLGNTYGLGYKHSDLRRAKISAARKAYWTRRRAEAAA